VLAASIIRATSLIALMMEAASTEDSYLHTHHLENLKSHSLDVVVFIAVVVPAATLVVFKVVRLTNPDNY
jgi:hypothetical protein